MKNIESFGECNKASIKKLLDSTKKKADFQRVQCVWLRAEFGMDSGTVSKITNLTAGTVRKIWARYRKEGKDCLIGKKRGGRKNFHLTVDEEKQFLAPFLKKEDAENILIVAEIKAAYEKIIGTRTPKSTIYRLLARHGWRRKPSIYADDKSNKERADIHEYWIEGCCSAITPDPVGNITQTWLNDALQSMVKEEPSS